jgi:diguanylate cyclase (GGDEF)-like protein
MQTANGVEDAHYPDLNNEPQPATASRAADFGADKPEISELLAAAEQFNAAFNTALYELEASRKLLKERAARIEELDESIAATNAALHEQIAESHRREEAHAAEAQTLNQALRDLETEREELRQQLTAQRTALEARAAEIAGLDARMTELIAQLDQQAAESRRAAEAHAREITESDNARATLQASYDADREKMRVLDAELEARTNELAEYSAQVEALTAELASVSETGEQREAAHREEAGRLQAELQSLNEELRARGVQLEEKSRELESRASELTTLKGHTAELQDALDAQALAMHEEAESHARTCQELNDTISRLTVEFESLKVIHDELAAHVEKLENLNRALHDSSVSETEVHRKILAEKDAAISALKARLEAIARGKKDPEAEEDAAVETKATLQALEQRLRESEAQGRKFAERAATADQLEAQVERLKRELQAARTDGGATAAGLPALEWSLDTEPARPGNDREGFVVRLDQLLALPEEEKWRNTLMYILLDNFMRVRDEIGVLHAAQVIDETYAIIESCCPDNSLITRFGDCTFTVLCIGAGTDEAQTAAERIRSSVEQHIFEVDGRTLVTSTSIGICALRGGDNDSEQVISRADLACESARLAGGNQIVMNSAVSDELSLPENKTRSAETVDRIVADNRITIYYQAISDLMENSIDCFEALTRVIDDNGNLILPGEFFAMAVNSGKAVEVDRHIIECVLRNLAAKPNPNIKLFIKLTRQSVSSHELPVWIANKLEEYRINPGQLVFEVAEQVMESDLKNLSQLSRELNKIGCRIAIEHYRLATRPQHLHHIHPEYLKIDRGLVQGIQKKGPCLAKVNEIMDLARLNNLKTIAEGVETPACLAILWELGVSLAQGYLISEPSSNTNFESFDGESGDEIANPGKAVFTVS